MGMAPPGGQALFDANRLHPRREPRKPRHEAGEGPWNPRPFRGEDAAALFV